MVRTIRTCSAVAAALALAGPAQAQGGAEAFVRARAAEIGGDPAAALPAYAQALADQPDPTIALRAYRAGLTGGDLSLVRSALTVLSAAKAAPADADLLLLADAAARGDMAAADAALDRLGSGTFDFLTPLLRAWRDDDGGATLAGLNNALTRRYARQTQALLAIGRGRTAAGLALLDIPATSAADRESAAPLLSGRGAVAAAAALLPGVPVVPARPSLAFATAELYLRLADDLRSRSAAKVTTVLARAAVLADPDNDRARLVLADVLADDGAFSAASAVLDDIGTNGPRLSGVTAIRLRAIAGQAGRPAALAAVRALAAAAAAGDGDGVLAGDYLYEAKDYAAAAAAYRRYSDGAGAGTPTLWLKLADALDRAGRWTEAKPLLAWALAVAPAAPDVLNAVGYARLEHGQDRRGSLVLLERALAARPADRAILDSVGWAYFKAGVPARAVPLLERAIGGSDQEAVIAEHLGDAYWAVGRRFDARYQWRAAAAGNDDPAAVARLDARIADGLPAER